MTKSPCSPTKLCATLSIALAAHLGVSSSGHAQFTLVDNFESYTLGDAVAATGSTAFFDNGGGWISTGLAGGASERPNVSILSDAGNRVLASGSGSGAILPGAPDIADASTASTYFFQIKNSDATPNVSFGLTDTTAGNVSTGAVFANFEVQAALVTTAPVFLSARAGGTTTSTPTTVANDTWINIWMVINNSANTWSLYSSTGSDPAVLAASNFAFRNGGTNPITSFMAVTSAGGANQGASSFYTDNIYFDATGENLINPIPEPTSVAMMGLGVMGLMGWRRFRRLA